MRQAPGVQEVTTPATALTSAPANGDSTKGIDMNLFSGTAKVAKYLLKMVATAAVTMEVWVQHPTTLQWARFASYSISTRADVVLQDIGIFSRVALVRASGSTAVTWALQEYIENNFLRGD